MTAHTQYLTARLPSVLDVARYARSTGPTLATPADVIAARAGDCAALSCALAGELRAQGVAASPRVVVVPGGLHVVVDTAHGTIDPSQLCARRNGVVS